jgi:uncharacterized membrane protein YeaQ/YmgE (transglycosylase-associated protein family)
MDATQTALAATEFLARSTTLTSVGWIGYIIIGGIAGWIASKIMGTDKQMGIMLNVVVGVAGALIGGFRLVVHLLHRAAGLGDPAVAGQAGQTGLSGHSPAPRRRR